jgi:hypothetical protein
MTGAEAVRVEDILRIIAKEVGPVGLLARVEIERAIARLVDVVRGDDEDGWWGWDDDDEPDDEPPPPAPPDDGPAVPRGDLNEMFGLKVREDA